MAPRPAIIHPVSQHVGFRIDESPQSLMRQARELTGIQHIVDADIETPLRVLLDALNEEAALNREGAAGMKARILRILCNRLRMFRDYENHPEIAEEPIVEPLFLCGAARTGSTKLQKLLAATGDFKYLKLWQAFNPSLHTGIRGEDSANRIRETDAFVALFNERVPNLKHLHEIRTQEPEEEAYVMEHANFGFCNVMAYVPTFGAWSQDKYPEDLRFLERALRYLQWQFHPGDARPWLLKWPAHMAREHVVRELFPDAQFVMTHRDPVKLAGSVTSVRSQYNQVYSDVDRTAEFAAGYGQGTAQNLNRIVAARTAHPEIAVHDVSYTELTEDALSAVRKIYDFLGRALPVDTSQRLRVWERRQREEYAGGGRHHYDMRDFGLDPEDIRTAAEPYVRRFGNYF